MGNIKSVAVTGLMTLAGGLDTALTLPGIRQQFSQTELVAEFEETPPVESIAPGLVAVTQGQSISGASVSSS